MSLSSYNKFLIRKTKFGIKNIDKIYSEIMHTDARKNYETINSINQHLGGQGMDLGAVLHNSLIPSYFIYRLHLHSNKHVIQ